MLTNEPFWRPYIWKSIFFFWLNFVKNLENNFCQKSKIYISGWLWDGDNKTLTTMSGTYDVYKWTEGGWYLQKHKWEVVKYEKIILQKNRMFFVWFDVKCIRFTFSGEMPFFFFLGILFFESFFSGHCFQLLNSSRRPGVILFPDFGCFSFSLKHHGSVLLVLSSETDKHKNLKYSLEEKKQWNSQTQKAFSDLPIWNLYLVWVILSDSVEPVLFQ